MRRFVVIAALAAAACDQPPVKEVAAAEQQVERARAAGAERYAPERWSQAQAALVLARQRLEGRDYYGALSAANDAAENARGAIEATGPARSAAREAAELAIGEIRILLDRGAGERAAAVKAGVPARSLSALDVRAQEAAQQLAVAVRHLAAGDLHEVEPALAKVRTEAGILPDAFREARTKWQAGHPRGRASRRPSR